MLTTKLNVHFNTFSFLNGKISTNTNINFVLKSNKNLIQLLLFINNKSNII